MPLQFREILRLVIVASVALLASCAHKPQVKQLSQECSQTRAAFDIGSGSTKVKLAEVDICKRRVFRIIWEESVKISFQEDLLNSGKAKVFSPHIMEEGRIEFAALIEKAKSLGAERAGGVATQAFREAKNGREYVIGLEALANQYMPTQILVVSHDLEARIGFEAGVAASGVKPTDATVWDIGGGSQQMAATDLMQPKRLIAFKGEMASTRFMNRFKLNDVNGKSTPNPIGHKALQRGIEEARRSAKMTVPTALRDRLAVDRKVIGIGGVHSKSIKGQIGKHVYTIEDLEKAAYERALWSDAKIGGAYAATQVSNLILVLGYMKELSILEVTAVDANLATGVLLTNEFWRDR